MHSRLPASSIPDGVVQHIELRNYRLGITSDDLTIVNFEIIRATTSLYDGLSRRSDADPRTDSLVEHIVDDLETKTPW